MVVSGLVSGLVSLVVVFRLVFCGCCVFVYCSIFACMVFRLFGRCYFFVCTLVFVVVLRFVVLLLGVEWLLGCCDILKFLVVIFVVDCLVFCVVRCFHDFCLFVGLWGVFRVVVGLGFRFRGFSVFRGVVGFVCRFVLDWFLWGGVGSLGWV